MSHDSLQEFDFELDAFEDDFESLQIVTSDVSSGTTESTKHNASPQPQASTEKSPAERIGELFYDMKTRRRILLGILASLESPLSASDLKTKVDELQEFDYSVFTAANYSDLLEAAGAITKCTETGDDVGPNFKQQPLIIEIEGAEYYKPADRPRIFWKVTKAGQDYLTADKPLDRLIDIIDGDNPEYVPVYRRFLEYCDTSAGRSTKELEEFAQTDPTIADLGVFASRFTDRLERGSALLWAGAWKTTDVGQAGLNHYAANTALTNESEA